LVQFSVIFWGGQTSVIYISDAGTDPFFITIGIFEKDYILLPMIDEEGELKAAASAAAAAAAAAAVSGSKNSGTPKLVADFGGRTSAAEPRVNCNGIQDAG
jgi:hypothetical protein